MAHGYADYGTQGPLDTVYSIQDLGELAARLGSIAVFDRRGNVIWLDDFEDPVIHWNVAWGIWGIRPVLSSTFSFMGAQSLKLECGAVAGSYSGISRGYGLVKRGKLGMEFWLQGDVGAPGYLGATMEVLDGVNHTKAELRYDATAETIDIITPDGAIEVATGIHMTINQYYFIPVKLVIDIDTDLYTRLLVGAEDIDLSSHKLVTVALTGNKIISTRLELRGILARITTMYIDNFILTVNEP